MSDLISREALIDFIEERSGSFGITVSNKCNFKEIVTMIKPVDAVEVVHGHWIVEKTASGSEYTRCSKCGLDFSWKDTKFGLHKLDMRGCDYCPACGAKMDEVSEDDTTTD